MSTRPVSEAPDADSNADPITGEPGSHPVATGVGAAAIGTAGMAVAAVAAGPIGLAAAAVGGAIIGGYMGKAAGEVMDPTAEEAFWRAEHPRQPYADKTTYQDYAFAYRTGYDGYMSLGEQGKRERTFDQEEAALRARYEAGAGTIPWEQARPASRAAWDRVHRLATQPKGEVSGTAKV